ncbi:hypothetical protein FRX31_020633 [Thalictrum thalictroides]|uniref:Uncharacterized protein n=1 Tax=Thalictrum thalictroides TaxID=46969 RepID=A0A7J6VZY4_THATH|nr:hypothetical protein FRX31_020633 [Thalictrum thalictroides]
MEALPIPSQFWLSSPSVVKANTLIQVKGKGIANDPLVLETSPLFQKNNVHIPLPKQTSNKPLETYSKPLVTSTTKDMGGGQSFNPTSSKPLVTSTTRDMGGGQSSNPTSSKPLVTYTNDICETTNILAEMQYDHFWDKFHSQLKDGKGKDHISLDDDDVYSERAFSDSEDVIVDTPEWSTKEEF